jgi:hypothetical protein
MPVISNRELARQLGVSETAVRRAEKAGRIRREADGAWDPAKVRAAWAGSRSGRSRCCCGLYMTKTPDSPEHVLRRKSEGNQAVLTKRRMRSRRWR